MSPEELGPIISRTTPRVSVAVFITMILLFVATGFLTRSYNRERRVRAEQQYLAGKALAAEGRFEQAVEMYTEAMILSRGKAEAAKRRQYIQALALALVRAQRTSEAEAYLLELIGEDPANGIANLALARIYVERGDRDRAMRHYHRAIYGLWPENPRDNRIRVRYELVGLFEQWGQYKEMEAELLRLLQEAPDDLEMKKRIGHLFMAAHSYDRAAEVFTEVTVKSPRDAEAYAGLGDAEFELAHYLSARTAYRRALRYRPDDLQSQTQYDLASEIIGLDPTRRGLGSATRLRLSQELVKRALEGLAYCIPEDEETLPAGLRDSLDRARRLTARKIRQRRDAETVDANIGLAEELENYQRMNCDSPPVPDRALELVLRKLAA